MAEKKPIVKLGIWKRKEAWYRLSPDERVELSDKTVKKHKELGVAVNPFCNCYWSCEEWDWFALEEHLDIESIQKLEEFYLEIGWQRYFKSKIYMGTQITAEDLMKTSLGNY